MSGFAPYGNFWNYYNFNKVEERLQYIGIKEVFRDIVTEPCTAFSVLNIGCNEGDVSIRLRDILMKELSIPSDKLHMLGIDLDHELILRAKAKSEGICFENEDVMTSDLPNHFLSSKGQERFNIVFVLSISMWIHLNHGDEGLDRFLERVCQWATNLIIEPHPWKCYISMRKRNKKNKVALPYSLDTLSIRNEVVTHIETKLTQHGFELIKTLGVTKWDRKILWYQRKNSQPQ